jgi:TIR domain-containing protein
VHVFLSHNHHDKELAVPLAAQLRLVGIDVWLDDWEIAAGDSIPGKVNEALVLVDTVVVLWSGNAAGSRWVDAELATALDRQLSEGSVRLIPIRLDDTKLPALLRPHKWLRLDAREDVPDVAMEIAGIKSERDYLKAIQETIELAGLQVQYFPGYGALIACPRCGRPADELQHWHAVDERRDDEYAGAKCPCGWEDGGEL